MKKVLGILLVLCVVALAAWGAATYWFGMQTEREYLAMIQRSSDWPNFRLTNEEYNRGIFSSQAKSTFELVGIPGVTDSAVRGDGEKPPFRLILTHKITHGPVPLGTAAAGAGVLKPALAVIETNVTLDPKLKELQLPEGFWPTVDATTVLYWKGNGDIDAVLHPIRTELGEAPKVAVDFRGVTSRMEFEAGFKRFHGTISTEGLDGTVAQEGAFKLKNMRCSFDQYEGASGFYLGDAAYELEHLEISNQDQAKSDQNVSLDGFKVNASARESGNDLTSSAVFSLDQLAVKDGTFTKAVLDLELRKLDVKAFLELQAALRKLQSRTGADAQQDEQIQDQFQTALMAIFPKLLKNSPEIEIRQAGFTAHNGEVRAGAKLKVDGGKVQDPINVPMLLGAAELDASFRASEGTLLWLLRSAEPASQKPGESAETEGESPAENGPQVSPEEEIRNQLSALVAQNVLTFEAGVYKLNAKYAKGAVTLNGQTIPLDKLMEQ